MTEGHLSADCRGRIQTQATHCIFVVAQNADMCQHRDVQRVAVVKQTNQAYIQFV